MKSIYTLGFSPCPNDTFMFDALVHHKIDTEGLDFKVVMADVETLNQKAGKGELDISKISFAAFTRMTEMYQLLNAGSALGQGVGPLVVTNQKSEGRSQQPAANLEIIPGNWKIAIPGKHTTANFLFSIFYPEVGNKTEMIFSEIENDVLTGKADAGVVIHESRFTYAQKGLIKICDLGELWEKETHQPIPLGGIGVKRNLPEEMKQRIDRVIKRSVEFAFANPESSALYVKENAQEMDEAVSKKHIETYVNDFSIDLGEAGRDAIHALFQKAKEAGLIHSIPSTIFVKQENVTA